MPNKHKLLCIVCPEGCEMEVQENGDDFIFSEGICRRGQDYARQEIVNPCRVLTTTVRLFEGKSAMLPVRTADSIPKNKIEEAMQQIASITVNAPVKLGQIICADIAGSGIPLVSSKSVQRI